jgi:exosortase A-associated hydrolase 1/exosortase A-associated hydrolase 2
MAPLPHQAPLPVLLDGTRGRLTGVLYAASPDVEFAGGVLVAPAFAEEMNRCRSMVSMAAARLSALGFETLVVDPYGTGDAAGEFGDADWSTWRADLRAALEWMRARDAACTTILGVRLGAAMAAELAAADPTIRRLALWQPVLDGKSFFTQFLRIRIAAELQTAGGIKSTDELRQRIAAGERIEVSGYRLGARLATELDGVRWPATLPDVSIGWFEVLAAEDSPVPRPSTKAIEVARAAGRTVDLATPVGPPFWQVHERAVAGALLDATETWFASRAAESPRSATRPKVAVPAAADRDAASSAEVPVSFPCAGDSLAGVLHRAADAPSRGVVVVVAGGPQYRAGAHRQFVSLARKLASRGFPVLRFDLRGMGDSTGTHRGFEDALPDIRAAIDALFAYEPGLRDVVLFGECESASGILFYAFRDERVGGVALVNPWVRTEEGRAGVIVKHYYASRLLSADFWRKVRSGQFDVVGSARSFVETVTTMWRGRVQSRRAQRAADRDADLSGLPLPARTAEGLRRFRGPALILMSGNDYIAREFDEVVKTSDAWRALVAEARVQRRDLEGADHTFSREEWKQQASDWVCDWTARA